MHKAFLYKKFGGNQVKCSACAWRCEIAEGKTGICGARQNIGGELYLLVWGRAVAANVDPMEKKPLYHFLPGAKVFSIGTVGCNFGCEFCQNFDISQARRAGANISGITKFGDELSPKEIVDFCIERRIPAIAFTYNEPAIFAEYAVEVMKLAKPRGIRGVFVSNGYETREALDFLEPHIDAYNIDLKSFSEQFYKKVCKANLSPVLETIEEIFRRGKWLEITTLLVPGENDSEKELREIANYIKGISPDIPWHISAFYPAHLMAGKPATTAVSLKKACDIGREIGLRYVYGGNIDDEEINETKCPKCGEILLRRHGFAVSGIGVKNGGCDKCGQKIAGVWE